MRPYESFSILILNSWCLLIGVLFAMDTKISIKTMTDSRTNSSKNWVPLLWRRTTWSLKRAAPTKETTGWCKRQECIDRQVWCTPWTTNLPSRKDSGERNSLSQSPRYIAYAFLFFSFFCYLSSFSSCIGVWIKALSSVSCIIMDKIHSCMKKVRFVLQIVELKWGSALIYYYFYFFKSNVFVRSWWSL